MTTPISCSASGNVDLLFETDCDDRVVDVLLY